MITISSSYDAIITTDITKPPEKQVISKMHELFAEFGYKLYSANDIRNLTRWRLSIRKDLQHFDKYIWKGGIMF